MDKRNFDGIQFEELRKVVDGKFNDVHDELSDCYYNRKPFREYGVLDKETFDGLHGLIWHLYDVALDDENTKQGFKYGLPADLANSTSEINNAKQKGLELKDLEK